MASSTRTLSHTRLVAGTLVAALISAVANAIVFLVSGALNVPLAIPTPPDLVVTEITLAAVVAASTLPAVGAAVLLYLLERFTKRGRTIFIIVTVVVLALSYVSLIIFPETVAVSTRLAMGVMHLVPGVVIPVTLLRFTTPQR